MLFFGVVAITTISLSTLVRYVEKRRGLAHGGHMAIWPAIVSAAAITGAGLAFVLSPPLDAAIHTRATGTINRVLVRSQTENVAVDRYGHEAPTSLPITHREARTTTSYTYEVSFVRKDGRPSGFFDTEQMGATYGEHDRVLVLYSIDEPEDAHIAFPIKWPAAIALLIVGAVFLAIILAAKWWR